MRRGPRIQPKWDDFKDGGRESGAAPEKESATRALPTAANPAVYPIWAPQYRLAAIEISWWQVAAILALAFAVGLLWVIILRFRIVAP